MGLQENQVHACLAEADKSGHAFTRADRSYITRSSQPLNSHASIVHRGLCEGFSMQTVCWKNLRWVQSESGRRKDYQFDIHRLPFSSSELGVGSSTVQTFFRTSPPVTRAYGRKPPSRTPKRCLACRSLGHSFLEDTPIAESGTLILLSK